VVQMFIKHVLGVDQVHPGLYGNTSAYYGTVEQQGRLTLHLHLLLWISGPLTPQEIRDRIMDVNSDFQKKIVEYLESVCVGEFLTSPKIDVSERVGVASQASDYLEPTFTLPTLLLSRVVINVVIVLVRRTESCGGRSLKALWMMSCCIQINTLTNLIRMEIIYLIA
jgi:hypothetical protein